MPSNWSNFMLMGSVYFKRTSFYDVPSDKLDTCLYRHPVEGSNTAGDESTYLAASHRLPNLSPISLSFANLYIHTVCQRSTPQKNVRVRKVWGGFSPHLNLFLAFFFSSGSVVMDYLSTLRTLSHKV